MHVALVVGSVLEELPVLVAVTARDLDQSRRGEDEVALRTLRTEPVGRAARDDDVIALPVWEVAEDRLERPRSLVHEDDLVALPVPVEIVGFARGPAHLDLDVVVP